MEKVREIRYLDSISQLPRILRSCRLREDTTVSRRDTNSLSAKESEPKPIRRQMTAGRIALLAALFSEIVK
jgi:hypothetical protein